MTKWALLIQVTFTNFLVDYFTFLCCKFNKINKSFEVILKRGKNNLHCLEGFSYKNYMFGKFLKMTFKNLEIHFKLLECIWDYLFEVLLVEMLSLKIFGIIWLFVVTK